MDTGLTVGLILSWASAFFLSAILLMAALHKWRSLAHFARQVGAYQILPEALEKPAARLLPVIEMALAAGLILPLSRHLAAAATLALMLLYAMAIGINLARGRGDIDCGCSGPAVKQPLSPVLLVRNAILATFALVAALAPAGVLREPTVVLLILVSAVTAVLLYLALDVYLLNRSRLVALRSM